ncbi:hypothetical protein HD597_010102 [Nonomuraea thailandensis]|uniref:Uncharacterized protein n=1 Tax=Nonomuraea thailandensis TaxID=1188745 RepID=A0A9X2K6Y8_9ACTN|nr:hypothetical protein [Nonomuraea thailandensis]MCP2363082.1 hypothetical protein [Nonomuraea thailandensis]
MTHSRRESLRLNPFGTVAAGAAVVLGALGATIGDDVSQGMTLSLHTTAGPVAHLWGVMFAAGGVLKIYGLYWHRTTIEIPGLWMMTGGYAFYSITVVTGLGMHGLAAGVISAALTIGCLIKVRLITRAARHLHDREREE